MIFVTPPDEFTNKIEDVVFVSVPLNRNVAPGTVWRFWLTMLMVIGSADTLMAELSPRTTRKKKEAINLLMGNIDFSVTDRTVRFLLLHSYQYSDVGSKCPNENGRRIFKS